MSAIITWQDAETLKDDYLARTNPIPVFNGATQETMKGLRFEKAHIAELLKDDNVTHLFLMFINSPDDSRNITLAATGLSDPQNNGGAIITTKVYDQAEICPTKCPSNI